VDERFDDMGLRIDGLTHILTLLAGRSHDHEDRIQGAGAREGVARQGNAARGNAVWRMAALGSRDRRSAGLAATALDCSVDCSYIAQCSSGTMPRASRTSPSMG
jgi:hypothetical protein